MTREPTSVTLSVKFRTPQCCERIRLTWSIAPDLGSDPFETYCGLLPVFSPAQRFKTAAGEDERAGRWRGTEKDECGIHIVNGKVERSTALPGPDMSPWS